MNNNKTAEVRRPSHQTQRSYSATSASMSSSSVAAGAAMMERSASSSRTMASNQQQANKPLRQQQQQQQQSLAHHRHSSSSTSTTIATQPAVRHAGRAHVRGKIRRVWRPRYLELWDNGLVRYYELPTTTTSASPYSNYSSQSGSALMIPKYTLAIYHARILDPTTFRDMHVGLPASTFGFVFRGQRLLHMEPDYSSANVFSPTSPPGAASLSSSSQFHNSNSSLTSSTVPGLAQCGGGGGSDANAAVKEQRDFLCAVSCFEEAQSWVVALQWAAAQNAHLHYLYQRQSLSSSSTMMGASMEQQPWWNSHAVTSPRPTTSASSSYIMKSAWEPTVEEEGMMGVQVLESCTLEPTEIASSTKASSATGAAAATRSTRAATTSMSSSSASRVPSAEGHLRLPSLDTDTTTTGAVARFSPTDEAVTITTTPQDKTVTAPTGKVVVSKVVQYRIVRIQWHLEIAYEIHVLLVRQQLQQQQQQQRQSNARRKAEQWSLLRTADDVQQLLDQLQCEVPLAVMLAKTVTRESPHVPADSPQGVVKRLPRFQDHPTAQQLDESLTSLDTLLRTLLMDATVLNAAALKAFLGLSSSSSSSSPTNRSNSKTKNSTISPLWLRWWKGHDPRGIASRKTISWQQSDSTTNNNDQTVTAITTTDVFVKDWLQRCAAVPQSWSDAYVAQWSHQRPFVVWCSAATTKHSSSSSSLFAARTMWWATAAFMPLTMTRFWQHYMPVWSVRVDYLVWTWVGAAYLGSVWGSSSNNHAPPAGRTTKPPRPKIPRRPDSTSAAPAAGESMNPTLGVAGVMDTKGSGSILVEPPESVGVGQEGTGPGDTQNVDAYEEGEGEEESDGEETEDPTRPISPSNQRSLSSPLPKYPGHEGGHSCWSQPDARIFHVRGTNYLHDRVKVPSSPAPLTCRGVDMWMTDSPERHIARHPAVLGGCLGEEDTFLVNFLLPFGNLVAYFSIPPLESFPAKLGNVWTKFRQGDQEYRDARLKLLPVVVEGPWIVKAAVGPGKSPALLGKVIPLQYFFRNPTGNSKGVYEVDVIITASTIAKGILSVVKGHTQSVSIAFAFIIEGSLAEELPETVLCCFQMHSLHLEDCPLLPPCPLHLLEEAMTNAAAAPGTPPPYGDAMQSQQQQQQQPPSRDATEVEVEEENVLVPSS